MIINHNISALNNYRQMGINNTANAKSMEKLSSGMRINKAGDDAAGLAISEKMRAQVRGLDQANRNSQDGISMIQTAEGALQETHNILQRMRELATQASNDTNVEVDRNEIQKEMNALTSEINRVGNTTEFNTQSLLKGNINKTDIGATTAVGNKAVDTVAAEQAEWNVALSGALGDGESATIEFKGVTINLSAANAGPIAVGTTTANSVDITLDSASDLNTQLDTIVTGLKAQQAVAGSPLADFTITENAGNTGIDIVGSFGQGASNNNEELTISGDITFAAAATTHGADVDGVDGVDATAQSTTMTFDKVPTEGSTFSVAGKQVGFFDSSKTTFKDATEAKTALEADFVIDVKDKSTAEVAAAVAALDFKGYNAGTPDQSGATAVAVGNKVTFTAETAGTASASVVDVKANDAHEGSKSVLTAGAAGDADATGDAFQMSVVVGSKTFTVDASKLQQNFNALGTYGSQQQQDVIDALNSATATDGTKVSDVVNVSFENGTDKTLKLEAKNAGTDNIKTVFTGTSADISSALGLTDGTQTGSAGTKAFENGEKNFTATFQVGANQGQSMTINIADMRANALNISGSSAAAAHSDVEGAKFTATSNVTNGTNSENVEFALDVSSHESATAAIKVINNAIENVSSQRSDLGAFQNRLEHTISNLGNASENLTAAESRVRDVDMAKEVMEMTRANILSQASQSMLAQANQKPQSVLQLLG